MDTSGLSNPLESLPEDIFGQLWARVREIIEAGHVCCNAEIMEEMNSIEGTLGECLAACAGTMCHEVGNGDWDWPTYVEHFDRMKIEYEAFISEYNGNRKGTVGVNDVSIVALAKTLDLPLVNMEKPNLYQPSQKKMRIPDVCKLEGVTSLDFNDFLRAEGITL